MNLLGEGSPLIYIESDNTSTWDIIGFTTEFKRYWKPFTGLYWELPPNFTSNIKRIYAN